MPAVPLARRSLLPGIAAAPFAIGRARAAARFSYKFASNVPLSHPLNQRMQQAADRIRSDSDGALEIRIFPSNQLGSDTELLTQLRAGAVEFFTLSGLILSTLAPAAAISGVGFAFPDYATVWQAMDGELGGFVRGEIAQARLVVMDRIWDNGFRHITTSTKPVRAPDDLKGFRMRVPVSPLWTSMFRAFGAAPVSINASEMYSALQTHIADGQENALSAIWTTRIYEVQKYLALTGHMWDGYWFLANARAWAVLPPDLRSLAARHIDAAALDQRADLEKLNTDLRGALEAKGMAFNTVDKTAFRDRLRDAGFYQDWRERFGAQPWALLERYAGTLP